MKKLWICTATLLCAAACLAGCNHQGSPVQTTDDGAVTIRLADTNGMDFSFDEEDIGPIVETTTGTTVAEVPATPEETTKATEATTSAVSSAVTTEATTNTTTAPKAETTTPTTSATTAATTTAPTASEPAVSDGILRITSGGTYTLSGNKKDTMILVDVLKGIFFDDDDFEHMACGIVADWGEIGQTEIRICALEELEKHDIFR